ncbi:MAG TPA: hypothetical protein VN833_22140 [Candidatus Acidoferrales bacterium]|jgi:hypothetical protein|nr:hypothetical protein [Candidatus Acidoferrales bacterium]
MCPFCLATLGLIVAGVASTGGLAALAVKVSRKQNAVGEIVPDANNPNSNQRRNQDVNEHD